MKTVESVARFLLKKKISFKYTSDLTDGYKNSLVQVTDSNFMDFKYAGYHAETNKLILMDSEYNQFYPSALKS